MSEQHKYKSDDSFLARWAENKLSDEELLEFQKTEAYREFQLINEVSQQFSAPDLDLEKALEMTKSKTKISSKGKVVSLRKYWYAAAASVVIIFGIFKGLNSSISYTIPNGGKALAINLPDGSKVQLNAGSELSHKRFFWNSNRSLKLNGEAYFEVEKGSTFSVNTSYGTVSVLGTKFNVKARKNNFDLKCFEGAVRFDQKNTNNYKILYQNDRISISNSTTIKEEKSPGSLPNWLDKISVFKDQSLQIVLDELSVQYNVQFEHKSTDTSRLFSGSFIHDNLEVALKTTLTPMGIIYTISEDKTTVYLP